MTEYLDVLVLCSDPVNLRRTLNLAQELVHFEQVIRRSELPIRLRRVCPPTLEQLQREFARAAEQGRQPSVFHFLGHGDDDGLYFENEHGEKTLSKVKVTFSERSYAVIDCQALERVDKRRSTLTKSSIARIRNAHDKVAVRAGHCDVCNAPLFAIR